MNIKNVEEVGKIQAITTTNGLKVGDWVYLEQNDYFYKGYILDINTPTSFNMASIGYYRIIFDEESVGKKWRSKRERLNSVSTVNYSYRIYKDANALKLNELEDKTQLIDLALMTGDEQWFRELVN